MTPLGPRLRRAAALLLGGVVAAAAALKGGPVAGRGPTDEASWEATARPIYGAGGEARAPAIVQLAARRGAFIQLPTRSISEWTPAMVKGALLDADGGQLMRPADLVEAILSDDRVQGVLSTRTHGLLGLPTQFFGDEELCRALEGTKALAGQPAIPGDWAKMFPEPELAQLLGWGILLGVGLAERVPNPDRAIGEPDVPDLVVWNARWLRHDWTTQKWYLMTADGEIEIRPGDGRWILYTPYGSNKPWMFGAWRPISFAWVLKQFALHDRARHSEVLGSPFRVGYAPHGSEEAERRTWLKDLRRLSRETSMVLEDGWKVELIEAKGRTWEIYGAQIEWADRAIAIPLAGQFVTTEGTKGFSNGNIHREILEHLIKFTAETLATCLHYQALRPWAWSNYGDANRAPWARWDTSPPTDKKEEAEALKSLGEAIKSIDAALQPSGKRANAVELCSKFGVPMVDSSRAPGPSTPPVALPEAA